MYKQGDVVVVRFPFTDGSDFKKRPAMVLSNNNVNETGDCLIVQITSKLNTDGLSVAIENEDCLKALPLKSFIRSHKIFTVNRSLFLSTITTVTPKFFKKVIVKISSLIEFEM